MRIYVTNLALWLQYFNKLTYLISLSSVTPGQCNGMDSCTLTVTGAFNYVTVLRTHSQLMFSNAYKLYETQWP